MEKKAEEKKAEDLQSNLIKPVLTANPVEEKNEFLKEEKNDVTK